MNYEETRNTEVIPHIYIKPRGLKQPEATWGEELRGARIVCHRK